MLVLRKSTVRCRHLRELGEQSTLSLPMISGEVVVGALNLYANVSDGSSDDDEALGMDLAGAEGSVLSNVWAYWTAFDLDQNLARSARLTADEAFDLLRRASQRENVKLRAIAQRIVERRAPASGEPEGGTS